MSYVGQAYAAPAERPTVTKREVVWQGAVVNLRVPATANESVYVDSQVAIPYLHFAHSVKNGNVHCHILLDGETPDLRGEYVTAAVSVLKKTMSNGQEALYVDLRPVQDSTPVTHRFGVISRVFDLIPAESWTVFETPKPLRGAIVFTPPDAKLAQPESQQDTPEKIARPLASNDPQLDRLLADGWQIKTDEGGKVVLIKLKKGKECEMIHHRRKK